MKNILCYGDSNTWGNIAGSMNPELMLAKRFDTDIRWTSILQKFLQENYHIIEAGLNGRTTAFDEVNIIRPSRNGLATLPGILEMHYPLDLVIFMLGTNDVKKQFNASVEQITKNMKTLIQFVKHSHLGVNFSAPRIMLIVPAPIFKVNSPAFNLFYDDVSVSKSHELARSYEALAKEEQCYFLDAAQHVIVSSVDGIHIEAASHGNLAAVIEKEILKIYE